MDTSGITGEYPGCCGRFNADPVRIRYRAGCMTWPIKPLPLPPRPLWTDPAFVFCLKWASWISLYVGSPSTLVRKVIRDKDLMSVSFDRQSLLVVESGSFHRRCVETETKI